MNSGLGNLYKCFCLLSPECHLFPAELRPMIVYGKLFALSGTAGGGWLFQSFPSLAFLFLLRGAAGYNGWELSRNCSHLIMIPACCERKGAPGFFSKPHNR
jgi:hypothetical protein